MMLFNNHKKGFVLAEAAIALAVVGILLTAILQLQSSVSQRIIFNTQTCHNLLEVKKYLYHSFIKAKEKQNNDEESIAKKIKIPSLEKYKSLVVTRLSKTWQSLAHKKDVEFIFIKNHLKEKNEK